MAHKLAAEWIESKAATEYRVEVFFSGLDSRNLPNLLRSFRDGVVRLGSLLPVQNMGIEEKFDSTVLWSSDRKGMKRLVGWLEAAGYEVSEPSDIW